MRGAQTIVGVIMLVADALPALVHFGISEADRKGVSIFYTCH
jgi:hypothetical protein